jgi:fatty acid desaturase
MLPVITNLKHELTEYLGKDTIRQLNTPNYFFDIGIIILLPILFFSVAYGLSVLPFGFIWILLLITQGFILESFFLLSHEMFIHRNFGGNTFSYIASLIAMIPTLTSPTAYKEVHLLHHYYLNTEKDPEVIALRRHSDNLGIRLLRNTVFGAYLIQEYLLEANNNKSLQTKLRFESGLIAIFLITVFTLSFFWHPIFWGYILPALIVLPMIDASRSILEHADADPAHPETGQFATFYKTNFFTQYIFLCDMGDCHLVHHVFDCIPFYRIPKAVTLMRPYLLKKGVNEHTSYLKLLYGFYIKELPQRAPWKGSL